MGSSLSREIAKLSPNNWEKPLKNILESLGKEPHRWTEIVENIHSGKNFSAREILVNFGRTHTNGNQQIEYFKLILDFVRKNNFDFADIIRELLCCENLIDFCLNNFNDLSSDYFELPSIKFLQQKRYDLIAKFPSIGLVSIGQYFGHRNRYLELITRYPKFLSSIEPKIKKFVIHDLKKREEDFLIRNRNTSTIFAILARNLTPDVVVEKKHSGKELIEYLGVIAHTDPKNDELTNIVHNFLNQGPESEFYHEIKQFLYGLDMEDFNEHLDTHVIREIIRAACRG